VNEVRRYIDRDGNDVFGQWLGRLRDTRARARIETRINRVRLGNFGDCKPVASGVYELRVDYGPGYRVYYAIVGRRVVLLLCAGDKTTQSRDVVRATAFFQDFKRRIKGDEDPA
jgi:putative addiction module killer protein